MKWRIEVHDIIIPYKNIFEIAAETKIAAIEEIKKVFTSFDIYLIVEQQHWNKNIPMKKAYD